MLYINEPLSEGLTCVLCTKLYAEVELQHSAIWMAGVYLMLLMQFLENKVAVDLTRSEFVEAQEVGLFISLSHLLLKLVFPLSKLNLKSGVLVSSAV